MNLPLVLILFRFILAPVILLIAIYGNGSYRLLMVILMYLGLISDILDGIIARKQNISTTKLRRMDSQTDMIFWLSIGVSSWILESEILREKLIYIWMILGMELSVYLISILKFKRETCTHAFLSKLWGVSLLLAFTSIIGFGVSGILFFLALLLGLISHVDRILITLLLPTWSHDIPSSYHAYLMRKGIPFKRNKYLNG